MDLDLVTWDDPATAAIGRSGTRYGLSPVGLGAESRQGWVVTADDQEICVAESASAAVLRIEHLEALRCFLKGLGRELSGSQLLQAKAVVAEMADATSRSLAADELSPSATVEVERSRQALVSIRMRIAVEQERRKFVSQPVRLH